MAGGIALQMEETKAASNSDIEAVFSELTTALEKQTGDTVSVNSLKDDPNCRSKDKCIASILRKTASTEVVFVSIEKKPSAFEVRLHRTSGGGLTPTVAKVELPRAQATWGAFLSGAAIMLFPEGANLTPPIVTAARPQTKNSQPMEIPKFEIKKTLPPPKPKPAEVKKPEPKVAAAVTAQTKTAEVKKPEPKPAEVKKPEPKVSAVVTTQTKPAEVKKPEPKQVEVKKPEPKVAAVVTAQTKPAEAKKPEPKPAEARKSKKTNPPLVAVKTKAPSKKNSAKDSEPNKPKLVMPKLVSPKLASKAKTKPKAKAEPKSAKEVKKQVPPTKTAAKKIEIKQETQKKGVNTADMLARAGTKTKAQNATSSNPTTSTQPAEPKPLDIQPKTIDIQPKAEMLPSGTQNFAAISVEPSGNRPWPWLALGASVISAGIGTYFGIENQNLIAEGELVRDRTRSEMYQDEVYQAGLTANVMFTTAAVSALASAILFMVP